MRALLVLLLLWAAAVPATPAAGSTRVGVPDLHAALVADLHEAPVGGAALDDPGGEDPLCSAVESQRALASVDRVLRCRGGIANAPDRGRDGSDTNRTRGSPAVVSST